MRKKKFDCVKMMRNLRKKLSKRLEKLSVEEKIILLSEKPTPVYKSRKAG